MVVWAPCTTAETFRFCVLALAQLSRLQAWLWLLGRHTVAICLKLLSFGA
jgi:hypothetical protein